MKRIKKERRELTIEFKVKMGNAVDLEVTKILNTLFKKDFPLKEIKKITYILRNKKIMMGGEVLMKKLFKGEIIIYLDYPGFFKENEKHEYKRKTLKYFNKEDFKEAVIHETTHAWHLLNSKIAKKFLKQLLRLDKELKITKEKLIIEKKRFVLNIYFEGLAQYISLKKSYFKSNDKAYYKNYSKIKKLLDEFLCEKIKNKKINYLKILPYRLGPHVYSSLIFKGKKNIKEILKYSPRDLIEQYEKIINKIKLIPLISYKNPISPLYLKEI